MPAMLYAPSRMPLRHAGFTLLEMIVVLVIIGLIMGLVGPRLFGQADKARTQTAETQVKMLQSEQLANRVIERLELASHKVFNPALEAKPGEAQPIHIVRNTTAAPRVAA